MNKVGFSEEEKTNIFKVVAAVLHVGNIGFEDSGAKDGISQILFMYNVAPIENPSKCHFCVKHVYNVLIYGQDENQVLINI